MIRPAACALLVTMAVPPHALAAVGVIARTSGSAAGAAQAAPPAKPEQLPVDLTKIREALRQNPQMRLDTDEIRFYVDIIGRIPTFEQIVGDYNLKVGPVAGAGMTHEEFLRMVTPQDVNSTTGITALDTLQVALTSYGMITMVKRAYEEYKKARTASERRAIQERIERELRELEKLRAGRGR
ncbi:MAG: hypothetical protein M3R55_06875 [Acidobacteriota bacterium]|nr:hypothetical protein [Acidobacteriota bacterium]